MYRTSLQCEIFTCFQPKNQSDEDAAAKTHYVMFKFGKAKVHRLV